MTLRSAHAEHDALLLREPRGIGLNNGVAQIAERRLHACARVNGLDPKGRDVLRLPCITGGFWSPFPLIEDGGSVRAHLPRVGRAMGERPRGTAGNERGGDHRDREQLSHVGIL